MSRSASKGAMVGCKGGMFLNAAARCHERAKSSMLLAPQPVAMELSRAERDDLSKRMEISRAY